MGPPLRICVRICVLLVAALVLAGRAESARRGPDPAAIRLKAGAFDPLERIPELAGIESLEAYPPSTRGGYLVQFERPITASDRMALEAEGASVKGYVPMMALEVVMTEASRFAVERLPGVRWVGVLPPIAKLPPGMIEALDPASRLRLQVSVFPGEEGPARSQLRGLGARVVRLERGRSASVAEVEVAAGRLAALLRSPLVRFVEPVYERRPRNDRARFHTGLTSIADDTFASGLDPTLDGFDESSGFQVKYGHLDGGLSASHPDFQTGIASGWISFEPGADQSDTGSGHGTHTAGSLVGDGGQWSTIPEVPPGSGSISQDRWRGIQPQAALHHISFASNPTDREAFERESEEGAQISTNSWGYCIPKGPFRCDTIADYNTNAAIWDEGVWDADDDQPGQQPLIVLFSAGNDGDGASNGCGAPGSDQVGTPATGKNVITVGANETDRGCGPNGDHVGDVTIFSSRGPVDPDASGQGLFKPDVTNVGGLWVLSTEAPGTGGSGFDAPSSCSTTGSRYRYEAGTSMSCPLTAGLAGVVLQDLVVNRGVAAPAPSLVKALLIHGARDLQPSGGCAYDLETDASPIHQGWGLVQATDSLYGPAGNPVQRTSDFENEVSDHALATGEAYQRTVNVPPGAPFKVTLVWTDYPASPGASSPLVVNDLDLEVAGPEGTFLGNNFVGDWSVASDVQATPDRYNVVENVYLQSAAGGSYTLTVRGFQVSQDLEPQKPGVNQDFSLVWSFPFVPACSDGVDNDGDERIDTDDPGCLDGADDSEHDPALVCDDGEDNDLDGFVDFPADPGCASLLAAIEDPQCQDGEDNDADGAIDFDGGLSIHGEPLTEPDTNCVNRSFHDAEKPAGTRRCGLGFELALALPLLAWLRRRRAC